MASERISVVVTRRLPDVVENRMRELFDVTLRDNDTPMTRAELSAAMKTADILVPTLSDDIDAALIAQAGDQLRLIANYGAGVDHIDVATARQRGILVSNTPGVLTDVTADMTMALVLAVTRRIPEGLALMQSGDWSGWSPTALLGGRVGGRRLGILGMGRIGQAVAHRASAFGMQIHYHNRKRLRIETEEELGATYWESLDQMVARMDVLSRGEVIDENAMVRMLKAGDIAGAGLDVYEHGTDINPDLRAMKNVVLLPHMGSATVEGRVEMGEKVIINIKTFDDGHRPPDQVVPSML